MAKAKQSGGSRKKKLANELDQNRKSKNRATNPVVDRNGRPAAVSSVHISVKPAASSRTPRITDGRIHPVTVRRVGDPS